MSEGPLSQEAMNRIWRDVLRKYVPNLRSLAELHRARMKWTPRPPGVRALGLDPRRLP